MIFSEVIKEYPKKIEEKFFLQRKKVQQTFSPPIENKTIVFILGCQRSGTTMMEKVFEKDLKSKVYGEFSKLSCWDPSKIRLNPMDQLEREFRKVNPPLIVLMPVVESQNIDELQDFFPQSKALWMFRHYQDVVASSVKTFGKRNGIDDIRPIVKNDPLDWRSEGASERVKRVVSKYFSEDMNEFDAAALFWYARNSLFFDLIMEENPRIRMVKYEDLVKNPAQTMAEIYNFIDCPFPGEKIVKEVHARSVGKGKSVKLSAAIEALCLGMQERLDKLYFTFRKEERRIQQAT